ncbi:MAG: hypothetical protein HWE34_03565 [Methylocystaceae bacterium]|nr:hypothetical protein [Methylocystaceae bacterium]
MMENNFGKLGNTQEEALATVEPMVSGILKAQDDGDYNAFCSFFEDGLREQITEQDFMNNQQSIQSTMGNLAEKEFLTTLQRNGMVGLLYKCRFDGSKDDFIVTITIDDKKEPLKASGIWIS